MSKVIIMGMMFDEGSAPDFGSIYRSKERHDNVHDYRLNSDDVSKLSQITNAAPGPTALCVDTGDIYVLMKTGWAKFGDSTGSAASLTSLNLTPISLDRSSILGGDGGADLTVEDGSEVLS